MRSAKAAGLLIAALVLLVITLFGAAEAGLQVGGISKDQAISIASKQVFSTTATHVDWALPGPFAFFSGPGHSEVVSPSHPVWAVLFSGTFAMPSCGPYTPGRPPHCPSPARTETVLLDYFSGRFILAWAESGS